MKSTVETLIEDLVQAVYGDKTVREQFLMRHALHNLVRLARAEQMLEIKTNVARLTRNVTENASRRKAKIDAMVKSAASADLLQQRLEFGDDRPANTTLRARLHSARHSN